MKAKNTVIETEVANLGDCPHPQSLIQAIRMEQAEVAFKAGIQEVVAWLRDNLIDEQNQVAVGNSVYLKFKPPIEKTIWQAKLKEWGILLWN